jgi:hypothetical protein
MSIPRIFQNLDLSQLPKTPEGYYIVPASYLDDDFAYCLNRANHTGTQAPSTISPQGSGSGLNSDKLDNFHASQTPTSNTIPVAKSDGKLDPGWLPSGSGSGDADTVDGFHASLLPAPNVIVPLDASGILDLSATSALISAYTIRRINGNNLIYDYSLAVGEEAIYTFSTGSTPIDVPLHISTSPNAVYLILIFDYMTSQPSGDIGHYRLKPNNTNYTDMFKAAFAGLWEGSTSLTFITYTESAFFIDKLPGGICSAIINTYNRVCLWDTSINVAVDGTYPSGRQIGTSRWLDKTTPWTSLGTMNCNSTSGMFLVRRLY